MCPLIQVNDFIAEFVACLKYLNNCRVKLEEEGSAAEACTGEGEARVTTSRRSSIVIDSPDVFEEEDTDSALQSDGYASKEILLHGIALPQSSSHSMPVSPLRLDLSLKLIYITEGQLSNLFP